MEEKKPEPLQYATPDRDERPISAGRYAPATIGGIGVFLGIFGIGSVFLDFISKGSVWQFQLLAIAASLLPAWVATRDCYKRTLHKPKRVRAA